MAEDPQLPPADILDTEGRLLLVRSALQLLEKVYVHLPLKRAMHAINPIQELRLLAQQAEGMEEPVFHRTLLGIFLRLRDLHTNYILPAPMNRHTAYLPFRVEEFFDQGSRQYVVTEVFSGVEMPADFRRGVILTHWNGVAMDRAVDINAGREAGSNPAARHARGLEALTMRWLGMSLPPDEDWVDVTFYKREQPEKPLQVRFEWMLYESGTEELGVAQAKGAKAWALGLDIRSEMERRVRRLLFRGKDGHAPAIAAKQGDTATTAFAAVFPRCGDVTTSTGKYGYIRIATFDVQDDEAFVREFVRLVRGLSKRGLIIDVRGNGGGLVLAGERLLQCLTPRRIEPEKFHFINSDITLRICQDQEMQAWVNSIVQATQIGTEFSAGFPLLPEEEYNDIGQVYQGPVVLITDALCYSTTDIFAAGFQDHDIGTIIGVHGNTGAGGANVWDYELLRLFVPGENSPFLPLPQGAQFRVAVRRTTRVGARSGQPLEDLGVQPDLAYQLTFNDLMQGNVDLIEFASQVLSQKTVCSLNAAALKSTGAAGSRKVRLEASSVDRVDIYLDRRPWKSMDLPSSKKPVKRTLTLPPEPGKKKKPKGTLMELQGFLKGKLVVAKRVAL